MCATHTCVHAAYPCCSLSNVKGLQLQALRHERNPVISGRSDSCCSCCFVCPPSAVAAAFCWCCLLLLFKCLCGFSLEGHGHTIHPPEAAAIQFPLAAAAIAFVAAVRGGANCLESVLKAAQDHTGALIVALAAHDTAATDGMGGAAAALFLLQQQQLLQRWESVPRCTFTAAPAATAAPEKAASRPFASCPWRRHSPLRTSSKPTDLTRAARESIEDRAPAGKSSSSNSNNSSSTEESCGEQGFFGSDKAEEVAGAKGLRPLTEVKPMKLSQTADKTVPPTLASIWVMLLLLLFLLLLFLLLLFLLLLLMPTAFLLTVVAATAATAATASARRVARAAAAKAADAGSAAAAVTEFFAVLLLLISSCFERDVGTTLYRRCNKSIAADLAQGLHHLLLPLLLLLLQLEQHKKTTAAAAEVLQQPRCCSSTSSSATAAKEMHEQQPPKTAACSRLLQRLKCQHRQQQQQNQQQQQEQLMHLAAATSAAAAAAATPASCGPT
ncbi:hypothetical protein Emag_002113 [Eimeria magna]